jgi:hypothetical protein
VLAADPSVSDAWIAALAAADLLGRPDRFAAVLPELAQEPLAPSNAALKLLAELLGRHAGALGRNAFAKALAAAAGNVQAQAPEASP